MFGRKTAGRPPTASRSRMRTSGSSSILPSRSTTSNGTGSRGTRRRRATCAPTNWRISASSRSRRSPALELHRQDHHLHSVQVQPLLECKRGLVVQQPGKPALVAEDELAGEKDAVRKLPLHFLGKL